MIDIARAAIFLGCLSIVIIMTAQLFTLVLKAANKLHQGSRRDSGIFPKRTRNVNAWFQSPGSGSYDNFAKAADKAYPVIFPQDPAGSFGGAYQAGKPARIGIPKTTACPIFRAQDDGSTDPLLIG